MERLSSVYCITKCQRFSCLTSAVLDMTYLLGSWESVMESGLPSSVILSPTS